MKHLRVLSLLVMLCAAVAALGQSPTATPAAKPATPAPQAQASPAPPATYASLVDRQVSTYEKNVVEAAEAMPADKFDFSPASSEYSRQLIQRRPHLRPVGKTYCCRKLSFVDKRDWRKDAGEHQGRERPGRTEDQSGDHSISERLICRGPSRRQEPDRGKRS